MCTKGFYIFLFLGIVCSPLVAQNQYRWVLYDTENNRVVTDAFVFLANSSVGDVSNAKGVVVLNIEDNSTDKIIISHINYETLALELTSLKKMDTIQLISAQNILLEATVMGRSKSRLWKKRYSQFVKSFLGEKTFSENVKILNPEVLLFEKDGDTLKASAAAPLQISNGYLGYDLIYKLDRFNLLSNKDVLYEGSAYFESKPAKGKDKVLYNRRRFKSFQNGTRHFLKLLVNADPLINQYRVGYTTVNHRNELVGDFSDISVDSLEIVEQDGAYSIIFDGYLTIVNTEIIPQQYVASSNPMDFSKGTNYLRNMPSAAIGLLRSKTGIIRVNKNGIILNPTKVEEFGYFTTQRTSRLLPNDYLPPQNSK